MHLSITSKLSLVRPIPGVYTYWTYRPSYPGLKTMLRRVPARWSKCPFPASTVITVPRAKGAWVLYFMFLPEGALTHAHRFTLDRLASERANVMIVCACPKGHPVLTELRDRSDALCWKELDGYDFSGYSVGLHALALHCPGSDVFILNDSMLGPFFPLTPFIEQAPWRLTGLSANALEENHLQSFAMVVRQLDAQFLEDVSQVITTKWCHNGAMHVILQQETRLARVANQSMSVGAYWYTDGARYKDLTLFCPEQLVEAGFPLVKKSLFGKFEGVFQPPAAMQALLERLGHPQIT